MIILTHTFYFGSFFAKRPHVASTKRTFEISEEIFKRFESYGFKATFHNYTTILAFSKRDDPNFVYVKDTAGNYFSNWHQFIERKLKSKSQNRELEAQRDTSNLSGSTEVYGHSNYIF